MYLDERSNQLLIEVFKNPMSTTHDLQKKFDLTYRQIMYSFRKINNWLKESGYSEVCRDEQGRFIVGSDLSQALCDEKKTPTSRYIFKHNERVHLIILMLGFQTEELSLNHLIGDLEVSKNTILRDLKSVQKSLDAEGLVVKYSRQAGYFIDGDEWSQRRVLMASLDYLVASFQGEDVLRQFLKMDADQVHHWKQKLERVEQHLTYRFTDQRLQIFPYLLEVMFRRIALGKTVQDIFLIDYEDLRGTTEYEVTRMLIDDHMVIPDIEYCYITLQLLTSSAITNQYLTFAAADQLKVALKAVLTTFEKKSAVNLVEKDVLLESLYHHMKPAYYRIKYGFHLQPDYTVLAHSRQHYQQIDQLVQASLTPLETVIGMTIPETERIFITFLIVSHVMKIEESFSVKLKAIIVCSSRPAIAKMMEQTLRNLFPEFFFYDVMSYRAFEQIEVTYDIVFASIPMEIEKLFFFVDPCLDEKAQSDLRKRVMHSSSMVSQSQTKANEMMQLIAPHIEVTNPKKLQKALEAHFATEEANGCFCTICGSTCVHRWEL
ncbi:MAG: transcription antiterminator [Defluviitaleaceae bacterium]|nr:transcription antiterminator [Defluviitaleaceae bacterium]